MGNDWRAFGVRTVGTSLLWAFSAASYTGCGTDAESLDAAEVDASVDAPEHTSPPEAAPVLDAASDTGVVDGAVSIPLVVEPPTLPQATLGTAYGPIALAASGGTAPYTFSLDSGELPPGVTLTNTGILAGQPTLGTYAFVVKVVDAERNSGTRSYSVTCAEPLGIIITPAALPSPATAYVPYNVALAASGGTGPYSFALTGGGLPVGMSFNSAGVLSGTPTQLGTSSFSVSASDATVAPGPLVSAPVTFSLVVAAPTITITPPVLPAGKIATAYSAELGANGGIGPYSYSLVAGALPIGMSFTSAGRFSGTPSLPAGTYNLTVKVTDSHTFDSSRAYQLVINP